MAQIDVQKQQDKYAGSFLALKSFNMVDPEDSELYETTNSNVMKAQGLIMVYSVFFARIIEIGNIPKFVNNRYYFYGLSILIPSVFHGVFCSYKFNNTVDILDVKYSQKYYNQYIKRKIDKKKQ